MDTSTESKSKKTHAKKPPQQKQLPFKAAKITSPSSTKDGSVHSGSESATHVSQTYSHSPDSPADTEEEDDARCAS